MKSAIKAALLSGFVFPGLGQIYLKKYKRGIAILIPDHEMANFGD